MLSIEQFGCLKFAEAADLWLESRKGQISPRTYADYGNWNAILKKTFGEVTLKDFDIGNVEQYQKDRSAQVGPVCVNHELCTLRQILDRGGAWDKCRKLYKPLQLPQSPGRALSREEETRLFDTAMLRPKWKVAYCCSVISANTTAGPGEIRRLRLGDVVTTGNHPHFFVREGAKNAQRVREILLNGLAFWAMQELVLRAKAKGATQPNHYLLPHRGDGNGQADPTQPMGSWRTAWESLREAAGLPNFRMYDLRHHAITKLLQNPAIPESTVIDIAGHVGRNMLRRYSHVRREERAKALRLIAMPSPVQNEEITAPEVKEKPKPEKPSTRGLDFWLSSTR